MTDLAADNGVSSGRDAAMNTVSGNRSLKAVCHKKLLSHCCVIHMLTS